MPDDAIEDAAEGRTDEIVGADTPPDEPSEETGVEQPEEPDAFPRAYVEQLRQENGRYRQRAQRADEYAQRLHTELVRATSRLADPTDLRFDEKHLDDPAALAHAVDELLTRKPHLASRRPVGEIGQGPSPSSNSVDVTAILRQKAR